MKDDRYQHCLFVDKFTDEKWGRWRSLYYILEVDKNKGIRASVIYAPVPPEGEYLEDSILVVKQRKSRLSSALVQLAEFLETCPQPPPRQDLKDILKEACIVVETDISSLHA